MSYTYRNFATKISFKKGFLNSFLIHPLITFNNGRTVYICITAFFVAEILMNWYLLYKKSICEFKRIVFSKWNEYPTYKRFLDIYLCKAFLVL